MNSSRHQEPDKSRLQELELENRLLKTIIDHIHEGVYAINGRGEIIIYNHEVEKTEGMHRQDVLGRLESEVYTHISGPGFSEVVSQAVMKTGQPLIDLLFQAELPNGRKEEIIISTYPFFDQGKLAAVYSVGRDLNTTGEFIAKTLEIKQRMLSRQGMDGAWSGARYFLENIIYKSDKMKAAVTQARKIAAQDIPVMLVGETGTGKELFAQGIHNASVFVKGPFVPINCAAIPDTLMESLLFGTERGAFTGAVEAPGLFEQAEGGTIFLDEINSMPLALQAKMLRVLQEKFVRRIGSKVQRPVSCRIISATNVDPYQAMQEKTIRPDLYYRLATVTLNVPPLRDRPEDIAPICEMLINRYSKNYGLFVDHVSPDVIGLFEKYDWPGNVRELQNILENSMSQVEIGARELKVRHLPVFFLDRIQGSRGKTLVRDMDGSSLNAILQDVEKSAIEAALANNKGNISKCAQELGIKRQALHYKLNKYGIKGGK